MSKFKGVSAVQWFANKLDEIIPYIDEETAREFNELLTEAKAMEKQQMCQFAFDYNDEFINNGEVPAIEHYYNETYGKKD